MPNPEYNDDMNSRRQGSVKAPGNRAGAGAGFHEKDAGFPGVPGKTQPKGFFKGKGGYKCRQHPKSEGLS